MVVVFTICRLPIEYLLIIFLFPCERIDQPIVQGQCDSSFKTWNQVNAVKVESEKPSNDLGVPLQRARFQEGEMQSQAQDRRDSQPELPEGLIRRHDATSLVWTALLMQREASAEKASAFLQASGISDDVIVRVLPQGLVREQDLIPLGLISRNPDGTCL